jgi:hypothetical protein
MANQHGERQKVPGDAGYLFWKQFQLMRAAVQTLHGWLEDSNNRSAPEHQRSEYVLPASGFFEYWKDELIDADEKEFSEKNWQHRVHQQATFSYDSERKWRFQRIKKLLKDIDRGVQIGAFPLRIVDGGWHEVHSGNLDERKELKGLEELMIVYKSEKVCFLCDCLQSVALDAKQRL